MHKTSPTTQNRADRAMHFFEPLLCTFYLTNTGYGRELVDYAETTIAKHYDEIILDASLSAKSIYLKRGYQEIGYHSIKTDNNDYLCYDVMKKQV